MTAVAVDSLDALHARIRDRVRDARARSTPLRIVGRGTWLDAGRPVRAAEQLSLRELTGITEYVPGDLTITVRAGTTLGELRDATAPHGQWLALDPFGSDEGTIGATLATASAGPLSTFFGGPRDLALGVEFITGDGVAVRGGGRVVKNVAGYDLTRLITGSWGTLGVVTEITFRLHAKPAGDETLVFRTSGNAGDVDRIVRLLRRLPFTPFACELVNESLARQLIGGDGAAVLVRIGGNAESVRAQRAGFRELGDITEVESNIWHALLGAEPARASVVRLSSGPAEMARTWSEAMAATARVDGALVHACPARGLVRCIVPDSSASLGELSEALASRGHSTWIGERLPAELWKALGPSPTADRLSTRLKATFDPGDVLNPGIFGELS